MTSLASIRSTNASTFDSTTYRPTALFVGGTAGIGEGTAGAFARATKGRAHIIICGRNKAAAERIIATFPKSSESRYEFIQCDATLMSNVVKASNQVKANIGDSGTLNYLVLTQGVLDTKAFDPTSEGIDRKMSLTFYSRFKFVDELMPCLEKAIAEGQEARVLSIMNPMIGGPLDFNTIGLKKNTSIMKGIRQNTTYSNIMIDVYSRRHPSMSFTHAYPGYVKTNVGKGFPWYLRAVFAIPSALIAVSIDDCGERMTALLARPAFKKGGFYVTEHGESVAASKIYSDEKAREAMVAHWTQEMGSLKA